MKKISHGFSLIELLIVISILAILCGIGIPSYRLLIRSMRADLDIIQLYRAVQFARHAAIKFDRMVTICGTNNFVSCSHNWGKGYIVFVDQNQNGVIESDDQILKKIHFKLSEVTMHWRSFQNKAYLQMTPDGFTNNQNGTFLLCSTTQHPSFARSLVINRAGRMRFSNDVACP